MKHKETIVTFLGDSITYGACLDDSENSYVKRVSRHFGWEKVFNHSLPGSRIGNYIGEDPRKIGPSFLERYGAMPDEAELIIVFGGTNDFGIGNEPVGCECDHTADTFLGALNLLMAGLREKYSDGTIVFLTPLHRRTEGIANEFTGSVFIEYVNAIRILAQKYRIGILDLYEAVTLQPTEAYYRSLMRADGIHPNDAGHEIIAKELIAFLEREFYGMKD